MLFLSSIVNMKGENVDLIQPSGEWSRIIDYYHLGIPVVRDNWVLTWPTLLRTHESLLVYLNNSVILPNQTKSLIYWDKLITHTKIKAIKSSYLVEAGHVLFWTNWHSCISLVQHSYVWTHIAIMYMHLSQLFVCFA